MSKTNFEFNGNSILRSDGKGVKINGNIISVDDDVLGGGGSGETYELGEHEIGTFLGEKLYRYTIKLGKGVGPTIPNDSWIDCGIGIGCKSQLRGIKGYFINENDEIEMLPIAGKLVNTPNEGWLFAIAPLPFQLNIVVIEYTKIED